MTDSLAYLVARLKEPSTYTGLAAILVAFHVVIPADVWGAAVQVAVAVAGLVSVMLPEKKA